MSLPSDSHFLIFYFPLASVPTYCLFFFPSFRLAIFPSFLVSLFISSPLSFFPPCPFLLSLFPPFLFLFASFLAYSLHYSFIPSFLRSHFLFPPFLLPRSFPLVLFSFILPYFVASSRLHSCILPSLEHPSFSCIPASLPSSIPSFLLSVGPSFPPNFASKQIQTKKTNLDATKPRSLEVPRRDSRSDNNFLLMIIYYNGRTVVSIRVNVILFRAKPI